MECTVIIHTCRYTSVRCFAKLVAETNDLAGQRELVAEYWQVGACVSLCV